MGVSIVFYSLTVIFSFFVTSQALKFQYHSNKELEDFLRDFQNKTENIYRRMYKIGASTNNIPLWVMELGGKKIPDHPIPNIKFVANIHGNEAVGRELLLHFMEYLRDNYERDERVRCLLDNTRIHLLPTMNPDGFAVASRGLCRMELGRDNGKNGDREDLNRNFPDLFHRNNKPLQPETKAIIDWMNDVPFVLSAGLHGGAMVANYPYDTVEVEKSTSIRSPSLTPDNDVLQHLASVYAHNHPFMRNSKCENGTVQKSFKNGITNGAAWYSFSGGMQDFNYFSKGCMEITLEISCCKYPLSSELPKLWEQNKKALLMFASEALKGVSGKIIDSITGERIAKAELQIVGRNTRFNSTTNGEFWRILLPGTYQLKVKSPGYFERTQNFEVKSTLYEKCPKPTNMIIKMDSTKTSTTSTSTLATLDQNKPVLKTDDDRAEELSLKLRTPRKMQEDLSSLTAQSRILTNRGLVAPEEERMIFLMIFGPPNDFQTPNITEQDIRNLMTNDLNITDMSVYDTLLKDFDKKSNKEKADTILKLSSILTDTVDKLVDEKSLRDYMRDNLKIKDFAPYEDIMRDFDRKGPEAKKAALKKLAEKYKETLLLSSGAGNRIGGENEGCVIKFLNKAKAEIGITIPLTEFSNNSENRTKEGIEFLRGLFENPYLEVSKITRKDMRILLRENLRISEKDYNAYFDKLLENFDQLTTSDKVMVFISIFDILAGEKIADTTSDWLTRYLRAEYTVKDLNQYNCLIDVYNNTSIFGKMKILVVFNNLLEQNHGNTLAFSSILLHSALAFLFVYKCIIY